MNNMDFSWIIKDINDSLIVKAFCKKDMSNLKISNYNAKEILFTTGEKLLIEESNINDISNFLNMAIVRFENSDDEVMDIPLRNIYMLYSQAVDFYKNNDNSGVLDISSIEGKTKEECLNVTKELSFKAYEDKIKPVKTQVLPLEKTIVLRTIDRAWVNHIDIMSKLRDGIHLRSYAQNNPLQAYVEEGFDLFEEMMNTISRDVVIFCNNLKVITKAEK